MINAWQRYDMACDLSEIVDISDSWEPESLLPDKSFAILPLWMLNTYIAPGHFCVSQSSFVSWNLFRISKAMLVQNWDGKDKSQVDILVSPQTWMGRRPLTHLRRYWGWWWTWARWEDGLFLTTIKSYFGRRESRACSSSSPRSRATASRAPQLAPLAPTHESPLLWSKHVQPMATD